MKTRWQLLALVAVAFAAGIAFLREPGFGDDLTYWSFAFDLHQRGLIAWQRSSFHDLRWPVWGVCWVLQTVFDFGLTSYYGEPLLYLAGGALLTFAFGKILTSSAPAAWACGIAFLFQPLLDSVCYRPMPDLSEGVWGGAVMLAWWAMMNARTRRLSLLGAVATGIAIFILEANRVTGAFVVPVVILCTLLFFPRRFGWVVFAGVIAAALYAGECVFYHRLFGDWLHDLTANAGNKGAKGTDFPNPWTLPFRFFDSLWKGNPLAPPYFVFAALGGWFGWRRFGAAGRVVVIWAVLLFLEYSCAPQSLWPYRPLLRDADRFLAGLAIPMSILAALGCLGAFLELKRVPAMSRLADRDRKGAIQKGAFAVLLLFAISSRDKFDLGFVPEMRRYLAALPDGTKVFSHKAMREIVFLVDARSARRFAWTAPNEIMNRTSQLEAQAAECTEFWYARKLVWLTTRKALEKHDVAQQPPLGTYFDTPERDWFLTRLFAKGDNPDLVFYRRRQPGTPPAQILGPEASEWQALLPAFPAELTRKMADGNVQADWKIPTSLRGRLVRFEFGAAASEVEALTIRFHFHSGASPRPISEYLLKPYLYDGGGKEFFVLQLPAGADTCQVHFKLGKGAKRVVFTGFRAVLETGSPP